MKLVVVANAQARLLRRRPQVVRALEDHLSGGQALVVTQDLDELEALIAGWVGSAPDVVGIVGGDGSVGRTVCALRRHLGEGHPPIALLHGGTMNTISRSMGERGSPARRLRALVKACQVGVLETTRRGVLRVDGQRHGFLWGMGYIGRFIQRYNASGPGGPFAAAWTLARMVGAAFTGSELGRAFYRPLGCAIEVDGVPWPTAPWRVVGAGTVDDAGLGFRPFYRCLDDPSRMHVVGHGASGPAFSWELPRVRMALPMQHPLAHDALATHLLVRGAEGEPYNLDGDVYIAGDRLTVDAMHPCHVVRLG